MPAAVDWTNGVTEASREVEWFQPKLKEVPAIAKQIFKDYSRLVDDDIIGHIHRVRDAAWKILPYPCIGCFRFLDFPACISPAYPEVIERAKAGETLLDLGCGLGQDIRKLIYDGAPAENLIGADSESAFHSLGYELFRDRDTLKARLITSDVFADDFLEEFRGKVDIVFMGSFLHLFTFDQQITIMKQVSRLLRHKSGSMIFGRHMAISDAGGTFKTNAIGWSLYYHSPDTFQKLLDGASEERWDLSTKLIPYSSASSTVSDSAMTWQKGDHVKQMYFTAKLQLSS
ncbi:hypothetical protein ANO14919_040980 [Xylariales sp. No.14919]|nr:hypothetical protein ANO14919_040980 [Xylariales sp. No.14919]